MVEGGLKPVCHYLHTDMLYSRKKKKGNVRGRDNLQNKVFCFFSNTTVGTTGNDKHNNIHNQSNVTLITQCKINYGFALLLFRWAD